MKDDGPGRDDAPDSGQDEVSPPQDAQPEEVDRVDEVDGVDEQWEADQADWLEEPPTRRVGLSALAGTFVLGVVTSLLVVLTWEIVTGDDAEGGSTDASLAGMSEPLDGTSDTGTPDIGTPDTGTPDTGVTAPPDHRVPTRLSRCASASRAIASALEAARPSLDQWAVHVGAMNKLVVGEITLQQATAFWERTRVGAQRRVADFREAVRSLRMHGVDCPSSALLAPGARALPGCVRQVEAEIGVLRAATTSIDTWDQHVQHMDMMLLGELSPEDATRMWLSMWEQGVRDLDAYRAAARDARERDGCALIGSAG